MDGDAKGGVAVQPDTPNWAEMVGSPERWTEAFMLLHKDRTRSDPSTRRDLFAALCRADHDAWHRLWEHEFFPTVLLAARDDHFCGCTWEELVTTDTETRRRTTEYVLWVLLFLNRCVHRIMTEYEGRDPYPREREAAVDILEHEHNGLWTRLWQVCVPFLDQATADEVDERLPEAHSLLSCVMNCSSLSDHVLRDYKRLPREHASAHILPLHVFTWIHTKNYTLRLRALEVIATSPGKSPHLLLDIVEGPVTSEDIFHAFCRDFGDPGVRDGFLYYAHTVMGALWPTRVPRLESKLERKTFGYFIGAYRRQLCLGDRGAPWHSMVTEGHLSYIALALRYAVLYPGPGALMPEAQFYGIVCIIAQWLVPAMEGKETPWPSQKQQGLPNFTDTLKTITRLFSAYRPPKPALALLGRHTHRAWQATVAVLDARRDLRELAQWREPLVVWRRLGWFMPADAREDDVDEEPRGVLERCAWTECECHVHRPLHPVKVCKGCWLVAYCGARCQTSDWEQGGHRTVCRRNAES
ncbi:zinc finger MYND domain-containing protein [Phanerochaete sordida]|uniref:Zinc finger MYND domain-containing protein n=1 Tax=Phanerochaete sordida TaxID=48140 RepID=A0A9P3G980_9APHY|nr:zinc finger MYND domain-containing protein [Phanerochaete sordida]